MSDLQQIRSDMADSELRIREALTADTPGRRLDAVMSAYWAAAPDKQDAFVVALAAHFILIPERFRRSTGSEAGT